jgi:two-component system, NarL family, sensor histidine kinase BarA
MVSELTIDWVQCVDRAAGNEAVARELLVAIIEELPTHKYDIITAHQQQDPTLMASIAHKVNGLCCYSGMPQLKEAARAIETAVHENNTAVIDEHYQNFITQLDRVLTDFETKFSVAGHDQAVSS